MNNRLLQASGRRFLCFIVALVMVFSLAVPITVMAAPIITENDEEGETNTGTLTIKKTDDELDPLEGAEFDIYKVVSIEFNEDGYATYEAVPGFDDVLDGVNIDELGYYDSAEIEKLAHELAEKAAEMDGSIPGVAADAEEYTDEAGYIKFEDLDLGWYLVLENSAPTGYLMTAPFLVSIPSSNNYSNGGQADSWEYDVEVSPKDHSIFIDEEIISISDHDEVNGTVAWGDLVGYQISTYVPEYPGYYTDKTFSIENYLSEGLTILDESNELLVHYPVTVTVRNEMDEEDYEDFVWNGLNDNEFDDYFSISVDSNPDYDSDDEEFEPSLVIDFTEDFLEEFGDYELFITFYADVNSAAVAGTRGNYSYANMIYVGGLEDTEEPLNYLPSDKVYVYSFNAQVIKMFFDSKYEPLAGAKFQLFYDSDLSSPVMEREDEDEDPVELELTSGDDGLLEDGGFILLDEGTYYLVETESPDGYTLLANPVELTITAELDESSYATGGFTMEINGNEVDEYEDGYVEGTFESGFYVSADDATAYVAIENHTGFSLPATGGYGIYLFLVIGIGGIAVLSVVVLRKRTHA